MFLWCACLRCCNPNLRCCRWRYFNRWHSQAGITGRTLDGLTRKFFRYLQALIATGTRYFHLSSPKAKLYLLFCNGFLNEFKGVVKSVIERQDSTHNALLQNSFWAIKIGFKRTPLPNYLNFFATRQASSLQTQFLQG